MWAVVVQDLGTGGAQRTLLNAASGMSEIGHAVHLVALTEGNAAAAAWLDPALPLDRLHCPRVLAAFWPLRQWLLRWRPSIVLSTMVDANILTALVCASLPRHRRPTMVLRETNSQRARHDIGPLRRTLCSWAYRRATAIIALSAGVGAEIVEDCGIPEDRVRVIGNPVRVAEIAAAVEAWRDRLKGAGRQRPLIVTIGRLVRQKGIDLLIEAMRLADEPFHLAVIGDGPDRASLERQVRDHRLTERITFVGHVAEPARWLAQADAFVLSSRWEGFGHVIVEAMAASVAVIAADCPHGPRDIIVSPEQGLLVEAGNPTALAAAIDDLLRSPERRQAIAAAGRRRAANFDIAEVSGRYASVLAAAEHDGR